MKKLLAVLLSVLMIMSCLSVSFGVFAEGESEAEALINKIAKATEEAITEEKDSSGNVTRHTAGYYFSRNIQQMAATVDGDSKNYLRTVIKSYYPEYSQFLVDQGDQAYPDFSAIATYILSQNIEGPIGNIQTDNPENLANTFGEATSKDQEVRKNSIASESLGDEVLAVFSINPDLVEEVSGNSLKFKDIDIMAGDKVTDSVIPQFTKVYPDFSGFASGFISKADKAGVKMTDCMFKYTDIYINADFDGDDRLMELSLEYTIQASATLTVNGTEMQMMAQSGGRVSYGSFEYFDEDNDFDFAELVKMINEGTANAVQNKAGYYFTKIADDAGNGSIKLDLTENAYETLGTLVDQGQATIFNAIDSFTIAIDNLAGTSITKYEWVCDGENCPVCKNNEVDEKGNIIPCKEGDHDTSAHTEWVCDDTCPVCQQHQDEYGNRIECHNNDWMEQFVRENFSWLSDEEVAAEVASMKERCTCGEKDADVCTCGMRVAPHNLGIKIGDNNYDVNFLINKGVEALVGKMNEAQTDSLTKVMELGAYNATVPASKDSSKYIEDRYALKETTLSVNDLDVYTEPEYSDGKITFYMPSQENPGADSGIGHLTNNFATGDEFSAACAEAVTNKIADSAAGAVVTSKSTGIVYSGEEGPGSPMKVVVGFEEATDENHYGNGKISYLKINYTCSYRYLLAVGTGDILINVAEAQFGAYSDSTYDEFNYAEYEKGDADLSQRVTIIDAKLVLKHIAGLEQLNDAQQKISDMDDNNKITVLDAKMILQKIAAEA